MIHPSTELRFIGADVGFGVFATAEIPPGTLVWVLDPFDRVFEPEEVDALPLPLRAVVERGSFLDPSGRRIFCWDHGRQVNHSCDPNCLELGVSFEIAARTIRIGEELTCDYGSIGVLLPFECRCGVPQCRGWVEDAAAAGDDPQEPTLSELWALADAVSQPLLPFAAPDPQGAERLADLQRRRRNRRRRERRRERHTFERRGAPVEPVSRRRRSPVDILPASADPSAPPSAGVAP